MEGPTKEGGMTTVPTVPAVMNAPTNEWLARGAQFPQVPGWVVEAEKLQLKIMEEGKE